MLKFHIIIFAGRKRRISPQSLASPQSLFESLSAQPGRLRRDWRVFTGSLKAILKSRVERLSIRIFNLSYTEKIYFNTKNTCSRIHYLNDCLHSIIRYKRPGCQLSLGTGWYKFESLKYINSIRLHKPN